MTWKAATEKDVSRIVELDRLAAGDEHRRALIERCVDAGGGLLAVSDRGRLLGYAVYDRTFFGNPFLWLVVVAESDRRLGVGLMLVGAVMQAVSPERLFTSTNGSNQPMQRLLEKAGFVPSGRVDNLDEGDPELVFVSKPR